MPKDILVTIVYQSGISPSCLLHAVSFSPESLGYRLSPPLLCPQVWTQCGPLSLGTLSHPSCPSIALTSGKSFTLRTLLTAPYKDYMLIGLSEEKRRTPNQ